MKTFCEICKDDGQCLNNEKHPDYEKNNEDIWAGTDYWDCTDYIERRDGTQGQTIMNWVKRLQEKSKEPKELSSFATWNRSINNSL